MSKKSGVNVNGVIERKDGTALSWKEFINEIKKAGLSYTGAIDFKDEKPKPIKRQIVVKKTDWALIRDAEAEGLMVSMNGIVERVRTDLNNKLSRFFRAAEPGYLGSFNQDSKVDSESVLHYINEYLEKKGVNKHLSFPVSSGSDLYLVPITENLEIKVLVVDEYYGGGESESYVMIDKFKITENCEEKDVEKLIEFVNKYLK